MIHILGAQASRPQGACAGCADISPAGCAGVSPAGCMFRVRRRLARRVRVQGAQTSRSQGACAGCAGVSPAGCVCRVRGRLARRVRRRLARRVHVQGARASCSQGARTSRPQATIRHIFFSLYARRRLFTGSGFSESPRVPSLVLGIRTPQLPLRPLWEKGAGGMRGANAPTHAAAPERPNALPCRSA